MGGKEFDRILLADGKKMNHTFGHGKSEYRKATTVSELGVKPFGYNDQVAFAPHSGNIPSVFFPTSISFTS
jgi:hypothetical protein